MNPNRDSLIMATFVVWAVSFGLVTSGIPQTPGGIRTHNWLYDVAFCTLSAILGIMCAPYVLRR